MKLYVENNGFNLYTGYGRFATYTLKGLRNINIDAYPLQSQQLQVNDYISHLQQIDYDTPCLSIVAPLYMYKSNMKTRILYSMTEASELPDKWYKYIADCNIQHIFTPSDYCTNSFKLSGIPTTTLLAGTDPNEFPIVSNTYTDNRPYTFLCFADRGDRKGWVDVWTAFFNTFNNIKDVRLLIKYRKSANENSYFIQQVANSSQLDERIQFIGDDIEDMNQLYQLADTVVIPSHSEGWGMIPRESAMAGIPTITLKYSGLDDGNIHMWSQPVTTYTLTKVQEDTLQGYQAIPNIEELSALMKYNYVWRDEAKNRALLSAQWLRDNQTWTHTVTNLRTKLYDTRS